MSAGDVAGLIAALAFVLLVGFMAVPLLKLGKVLDETRTTIRGISDESVPLLQEVTTRLPGRVDANQTAFSSVADLAAAMRRAETAHGQHEKRTGVRDAKWADWYAEYLVAEQAGKQLPT